MSLQFKEILYHETVFAIDKVDVAKGRGNKDIGKDALYEYINTE